MKSVLKSKTTAWKAEIFSQLKQKEKCVVSPHQMVSMEFLLRIMARDFTGPPAEMIW